MKKIKIVLFVLFLMLILYYILSIVLTRNGQFTNYHFPAQLSIENAIYNENFIRKIEPDKIEILDTLFYETIKDDLEIYLCEAYYYKNYGILNLFNHRLEFDNSICLNINSKRRKKMFIEYNDEPLKRIGNSESYWNIFKIGTDIDVKIFDENKDKVCRMLFLNIRSE